MKYEAFSRKTQTKWGEVEATNIKSAAAKARKLFGFCDVRKKAKN